MGSDGGAASLASRRFCRRCAVPLSLPLLLLLAPVLLLLLPFESALPMRSKILLPKVFGDSTLKPDVTMAASNSSSVIACAAQCSQQAWNDTVGMQLATSQDMAC